MHSEPVSDKHGRRVTAKGIGSAQLHYPSQLLCPPAGHSRLAGASRAHTWGWQLGFLGHLQPALVLSLHQAALKYCLSLGSTVAVALNQDCRLFTSRRRAAVQCWAGSATPKTSSEWLLPGSQSLRVLLTLAQCCPCSASLGHLDSSILAPTPSPHLGRWNPKCLFLGDASTLAMPAAQHCLYHSPHWLRTALCHSQSQMSTSQQRGGSSTGEDPQYCGFPFWAELSPWQGRVLGVGAATFPPRPGQPRVWWCGFPTWSAPGVGVGGDLAAGPRCRGELPYSGEGCRGLESCRGCSGCP